jgi:tight adherence protein B
VITALLAATAAWVWLQPPVGITEPPSSRRPIRIAAPAVVALTLMGVAVGAPVPFAVLLVLALAGWGGRRLWSARARAVLAGRARERVLECCELLSSELSAGQPPEAALATAADEWPTLAPVAQGAAYGGDVPAALRRVAAVPGADDLRLVAAAWQVSHRTGHGLADALARVAATLRNSRATERVVRGELASARATARLVAALPVMAWVIGWGSGGDPWGFLLATLPGVACLAAGLALLLAGLAWIERIAAGVER